MNALHHDNVSASIVSSFVTGLIVAIPEAALSYVGKIVSVFCLAIVAELGRRLVQRLSNKGNKES